MKRLIKSALTPLAALTHHPWPLSTATAPQLDTKQLIEEETTPRYNPCLFYPARLGQVLGGRYQVATKLGYGASSTVWLARDLDRWRWQGEKYVALKIGAGSLCSRKSGVQKELEVLQRIGRKTRHQGYHFVRHILDSFDVKHQSKRCPVLVFEALREPLWMYRRRFIGDTIPSDVLKIMLQMILHGLDYLHSECHIIHTDLKPDNIMIKIEDPSILEQSAKKEHAHPLPQKTNHNGRITYLSRNNFGLLRKPTGIIQITDFDLSVSGEKPRDGCIQVEIYRAPEVILDAGYSYSADIWNLGVMLWDVLESNHPFEDADPANGDEYDELDHLARINALLGHPPQELLEKGKRTSRFYGPGGVFHGPTVDLTRFHFENVLENVKGEDKRMFIEFVKRMIRWRPEERSTAGELLQDPWLYAEFED